MIRQRGGGLEVRLDTRTALPLGLADGPARSAVPLPLAIEVEAGGDEVPGTMGGLTYRGTSRQCVTRAAAGTFEHVTSGPDETYRFDTLAESWRVRCTISLRSTHPRVELRVAVTPLPTEQTALLRDLHLWAEWPLDELGDWCIEAPGNTLRSGVRLSDIADPVGVLTVGHHLGSPGIVVLHHPQRRAALVVWPFSRSEQGQITLVPSHAGVRLQLRTQLAGAIRPGEWLEHGPIYLDVVDATWDELRPRLRSWYPAIGLTTPRERPSWASALNLFEVMIGFAPFHGGDRYAPYPTVDHLVADLDRIAGLGIECLQLMPRHPYPSYNIHEPGDVRTTYCEPDELRDLVAACHDRGMRIILDILMHGVLDKKMMTRTVELVRQGPHANRLDGRCADPYGDESEEISWCRHILAFAPFWLEGAPDEHPLLTSDPDWFMRDSRGAVAGVYTNALDPANAAWHENFVTSCENLVRDYGIDGFRLDAPLYNRFANWSPAARRHASYASLGAYQLLRKLRERLRRMSPDVLLYSEPGGLLARESLDLNYGYEEKWLASSLFDTELARANDWRRVRTGRELAAWFRDFDALLPDGSVTAHFVDAHDTMWWRLPGDWWRRDQIGLPATRALLAIYALRGGAYMTFVGGEDGLEDELRLVHGLRAHLPEVRAGASDYDAITLDHAAIYAVLRHTRERATIVAVNTSGTALRASCTVRVPPELPNSSARVRDVWSDEWLSPWRGPEGDVHLDLAFGPYQARVVVLHDLPEGVAWLR